MTGVLLGQAAHALHLLAEAVEVQGTEHERDPGAHQVLREEVPGGETGCTGLRVFHLCCEPLRTC